MLARIEELTEQPVTKLFQVMEGSSVSGFLIAGMNVRKSNDLDSPDYNQPRYTMKEGLELFIKETPIIFPNDPDRIANMLKDQAGDVIERKLLESADAGWDDLHKTEEKTGERPGVLDILWNGLKSDFKTASALTVNGITHEEDYMYDPEKLKALFKKVLGPETRLSDSLGSVSLPTYNLKTQMVEYFNLRKEDLLDIKNNDSSISHEEDPYLWEVAMAQTANVFAYSPYVLNDQIYSDGAMMQNPLPLVSGLFRSVDMRTTDIKLVSLNVKPDTMPSINNDPDYDGDDAKFAKTHGADGAIGGLADGRLSYVFNYAKDMQRQTLNNLIGAENVISISPLSLDDNENPADYPDHNPMKAMDVGEMGKILDYADRVLLNQDRALKDLAITLVKNQVLLGNMTPEDYEARVQKIESSSYERSTVPELLETLKPSNTDNQVPAPSQVSHSGSSNSQINNL